MNSYAVNARDGKSDNGFLYEYPFHSKYKVIDGVRLHYLDEGDGPVIWLMHGMPMWSYVFRKIITPLVEAGYRVFAPDLMGFGYSDKPTDESKHHLKRHVDLMTRLIDALDLKDITVVGQDWGGPISLRYAIENKLNIQSIILLNTFIERFPESKKERQRENIITSPLPPGYALLFKNGAFSSFLVNRCDVFRKFVWQKWKTGNSSKLLGAGFRRSVKKEAMKCYQMPHKNPPERCGIAAFAKMIPDSAQHANSNYINDIRVDLERWHIPVLVLWPDGDMAWKPDEGERIASLVPDGEFHLISNTGHYLQEDDPETVSMHILNFLNDKVKSER